METIDRVREARKQADIAYEELGEKRDPDDVLASLARAEECLGEVVGALEEEGE